MTWAVQPVPADSSSITMTATTATDISGVEYFFENLSVSGHDSGWQSGATYVDTGLTPNTVYDYRVKARDRSVEQNETGYSATASATTDFAGPESHYSDDFESGSLADGDWTSSGNVNVTGSAAYNGSSYGVQLSGTASIERAQSTSGYGSLELHFASRVSGMDSGEFLFVEWSGNGGVNWNELERYPNGGYSEKILPILPIDDSNADDNAAFRIRFRTNASSSREYARIDDIEIIATPLLPPLPPELPGLPSTLLPTDGAGDVNILTALSWTAGADATSHEVFFGTSPPPDSDSKGIQTGTTFTPNSALLYGTTYYWSIDEINVTGTTSGPVWSFTTQVAPPMKADSPTPIAGATNVSAVSGLTWNAGSGATSHNVYFGLSNPPTLVQADQVGSTYDPGAMQYQTIYFWRIDEVNGTGTTTGDVWSFTTEAGPPGPANYINPADESINVSVAPTLTWDAGATATAHNIYFGVSNPPLLAKENQTGTSYDPGTLENQKKYYWSIEEINGFGTTQGPVWSFTTEPPAPEPAAYPSPANGAIDVSSAPTLTWNAGAGATSHEVYFGTSSAPASQGIQTGTSFMPDTALLAGTTYYWGIVEFNSTVQQAEDVVVWSFTTAVNTDPVQLFADSFESGDFSAGWSEPEDGTAGVGGSASFTGSLGAELRATSWMEVAIDTTGYHSIQLKYARRTRSYDNGELLKVQWSDGNSWHTVEQTNDTSWGEIGPVNLTPINGAAVIIRFETNANSTRESSRIDDVEVTGIPN